jgi:hypothetical protein
MGSSPKRKQFVALAGRYAAGLLVAIVASVVGLLSTPSFAERLAPILSGFAGVFLGSLCLERRSRLVGSMLFTVLGLAFYLLVWTPVQFHMQRFTSSEMSFPLMPGLALGGFLATTSSLLWRYATGSQQNAPPNGGSTEPQDNPAVGSGPPSVS